MEQLAEQINLPKDSTGKQVVAELERLSLLYNLTIICYSLYLSIVTRECCSSKDIHQNCTSNRKRSCCFVTGARSTKNCLGDEGI